MASLPNLPFFQRAHAAAKKDPKKPAIIDTRTNKTHTYVDLLKDAQAFRQKLVGENGPSDLKEERIAALVPNGCELQCCSADAAMARLMVECLSYRLLDCRAMGNMGRSIQP